MKLRQRKRAHMRNKRAQLGMVGRWMYYQHARVWVAIERSLLATVEGHGFSNGIQTLGQAVIKDIQRIIVRKMVADIVGATHPLFDDRILGKNPVGVILDEFGAIK